MTFNLLVILVLTTATLVLTKPLLVRSLSRRGRHVPVSVNYHFTRKCNYSCGFCFHTATTSHVETANKAKKGLLLLKLEGMRKINFAGGEPFLYPKLLADMAAYCKQTLRLESVSIVTNGSLVKYDFLRKHGRHIDILAVSCDSFDEATNLVIGRSTKEAIGRGTGEQVRLLYQIADWCREFDIKFKINTVVNRYNFEEDMNRHIDILQPFRWKCFQVLVVKGENDSEDTLRDVRRFVISDEEFGIFCRRHEHQPSFVPESNRLMATSYLILDEYLRFLDRTGKQPSKPITEVGVEKALASICWDEAAFLERGGIYDWAKEGQGVSCGELPDDLKW